MVVANQDLFFQAEIPLSVFLYEKLKEDVSLL